MIMHRLASINTLHCSMLARKVLGHKIALCMFKSVMATVVVVVFTE